MERSIASLGLRGRLDLVLASHLSSFDDVDENFDNSATASLAFALVSLYWFTRLLIVPNAEPMAASSANKGGYLLDIHPLTPMYPPTIDAVAM